MPHTARPLAVGLVYRSSGTPGADRSWARSLVVRHAHREGLGLVDIFELDDNLVRNAAVLDRLSALADDTGAAVLISDSVDLDLAQRLAEEFGLRLETVPRAVRRP